MDQFSPDRRVIGVVVRSIEGSDVRPSDDPGGAVVGPVEGVGTHEQVVVGAEHWDDEH